MPRAARLDYPGALHHVIVRGIERRKIFRSDRDRKQFLARLAPLVTTSGAAIYAWALMPNHAHVLLRTGNLPLSILMRRCLAPYALTFNRVHRRVGHLFQNRFKNTLVEEEPYLLELVRYIHLNPVRSRLPVNVDSLDHYPWTGHAVLLGQGEFLAQDSDFVLQRFGRRIGEARRAYRSFVREGMERGKGTDLEGGGLRRSARGWEQLPSLRRGRERWAFDERILGGSEFVQTALHRSASDTILPARPDSSALLADLTARVAAHCAVTVAEIAGPTLRRDVLAARALVSSVAVHRFGFTLTAVARHLGVSVMSIVRAIERAKLIPEECREGILDHLLE